MKFSDSARLLDPSPMPLEMGFERLDDGVLHVAVRTDMHRCTGAMFEWWFGFRPGTREYVWWHPTDHVASEWAEAREGTHIGSIHHATERFVGGEPEQLAIQFRDPEEFFESGALAAARARGAVSGLVCAHGGPGPEPRRRPDGAIIGTRLIHLCRDTAWGMALRTHFFLGHDLPGMGAPRQVVEQMFPDDLGPRLLQHCYDEFSTLARFLPSLHDAEGREGGQPLPPW
jgi:hypothetical protein